MQTGCSAKEMDFGRAGGRCVVADFDGGMASSDACALLLGDPVMGVLLGKLERQAEAPAPLADKSTLNRNRHGCPISHLMLR